MRCIGSDGTDKPYRLKVRPPSFCNLSALRRLLVDTWVATAWWCWVRWTSCSARWTGELAAMNFLIDIGWSALGLAVMFGVLSVIVLSLTWLERKALGRLQLRYGPTAPARSG